MQSGKIFVLSFWVKVKTNPTNHVSSIIYASGHNPYSDLYHSSQEMLFQFNIGGGYYGRKVPYVIGSWTKWVIVRIKDDPGWALWADGQKQHDYFETIDGKDMGSNMNAANEDLNFNGQDYVEFKNIEYWQLDSDARFENTQNAGHTFVSADGLLCLLLNNIMIMFAN